MASASRGKEYSLAVKIAGSVASSFNSAMGAAENRISGLGQIAKQAAAIASAAWGALKIGEFVTDSVQAAVDFESAMADVAKVVDGLRDENGNLTDSYYAMSDSIVQMSKDIPMAAEDLAAITASAGTAGIAAEELTAFTETAAKMGVAFDTTADQAGDWMAKWRTSFSMGQEEVTALADQINYLSNNSASTASEISTIVTAVGPLGDVAGISAAQIAALGSTMVGVGVQQDVAATGIRKLATTMVAGSSATKAQATVLQQLGLDATEMAERMQTDAEGAILTFLEAVSKLPEAEQAAALKNYFGQESVGAIAPLLTNLDVLRERFEMVADAQLYAGSMDAEYAARAATTANNIQLYENRIAALKIQIGDYLLPVVNKVLAAASGGLDWISDKIASAEGTVSGFIGTVQSKALAIFTMIRPKLESIGAKAQEIFTALSGQLTAAFEAVQPALNWIIDTALPTAISAVLDLVDAFGSVVLTALEFKEVLIAAAAVYGAFKAGKALQSMIQGFQQAKVTLALFKASAQGATIAQAAFNGTLTLGETLTALFTGQVTLAQLAQAGWATVTGAVTKAFGALNAVLMANPIVLIVTAIAAVIAILVVLYTKCEGFRNFVNSVASAIVGFVKNAASAIAGFFKNLWATIQGIWSAVSGWFKTNVIDPVVNFFAPIVQWISGFFRGCWIIIQAVWAAVSGWFKTNVIDPVVNFFAPIPGIIGGFFSGLWTSIQSIWATVSGWFSLNVIQPLVNFFAPIVESIGGFFANLWASICSIWQAAGTWFSENVTTPINNAFQAIGDFVKGIFNGLIGLVEGMINRIIGAVNGFIGGFNDVVGWGASFIGVDWEGLATIPEVSLPRLAKGGIVDSPTILEAGEAGTEAIVPLSELWGKMQSMISGPVGYMADRVSALADRMEAMEIGSTATPISELLAKLQELGRGGDPDPDDPEGGGPVYHITYAPQYCFEGGAPSREDMTDAEHISQEEFERRMNQWMKDNARKRF
ncbi:phage tail tape measure protein [Candidatus Allofournierella excrementavium]|uniref:phage tail tape measure protein n=1 Tax=Candidatus Allofournierella excrementavium TaxID=2838591 RepID=UPI003AB80542